MSRKRATGWTTLWPWVVAAFALLATAWVWLIVTAAKNVPEPIEIRKAG